MWLKEKKRGGKGAEGRKTGAEGVRQEGEKGMREKGKEQTRPGNQKPEEVRGAFTAQGIQGGLQLWPEDC